MRPLTLFGFVLLAAGSLGLLLSASLEGAPPALALLAEPAPAQPGEAGQGQASGTINAALGGVVAVRDLMEDRAQAPVVKVGQGPLRVLVEAEQAAALNVKLSLEGEALELEGEPPLSALWPAGPGSVRVEVLPGSGSVHTQNRWTVSLAWG